MEYSHAGVTIKFNEKTAKFSALVEGKPRESTGLQAIKNLIDKAAKTAFQPFAVIFCDCSYGEDYELREGMATGIERPRKGGKYTYRARPKWIVQNGRREYQADEVAADTPANRDAIAALVAHKNETRRIRTERDEEETKLDQAISRITPSE